MQPMHLYRATPREHDTTGSNTGGIIRNTSNIPDAGVGATQEPSREPESAPPHGEEAPEPSDQPEYVESSAAAIADKPRLWRTLLFAHQPDRHGRCIACVGTEWPCGPRRLAERAERIYNDRPKKDP